MIVLLMQKTAPDIAKLVIPLLGILIVILVLNSVYEWFKTKPWKRNKLPNEVLSDDTSASQQTETPDKNNNTESDRTQLFIDAKPLQNPS
jgi:hypothetical protein